MRSAGLLLVACVCLSSSAPEPVTAAPAESDAYHIVLAKRALGAGESLEFRLVPPPPAGVRVNYGPSVGATGVGVPHGVYRAPYVIPPGTPPAQVSAGFSNAGVRAGATAEIELLPGSVPGAEDCLGPGQSFSTVTAEIVPGYIYLDQLPTLIQRVEPEYPRGAFARGIEDTIPIRMLVCRSGRVLDAIALPSYRGLPGTNPDPVEHDPKLVDAAIAAARQYVFSPGMVGGHAVAVWVATPVAFRR